MDVDGHLGDDLSALLDGELDEHEVGAAQAHLATCDRCRDELVAVQAGRDLLRGLPFVDPPAGFLDGVIGRRRRRRHQAVIVAVLASVATFATLVVGGAYHEVPEVDAELASLEQAHQGTPVGQPTEMEDLDGPMHPVSNLAGLDRTEVHMGDELVQITYSDDDGEQLTVFEGYGSASDDWLHDARPMAVQVDGDTEEGFIVALDDARMLVVELGDVVYALVGDRSDEELAEAAEDLPEQDDDDGFVDRTQTVIVRIGEVFSP
jgi:anti-sigma factor RsiW